MSLSSATLVAIWLMLVFNVTLAVLYQLLLHCSSHLFSPNQKFLNVRVITNSTFLVEHIVYLKIVAANRKLSITQKNHSKVNTSRLKSIQADMSSGRETKIPHTL